MNNIAANALNSLGGKTEKLVIEVFDKRAIFDSVKVKTIEVNGQQKAIVKSTPGSGLGSFKADATVAVSELPAGASADAVKAAKQAAAGKAKSIAMANLEEKMTTSLGLNPSRKFVVQYNPSSISFSATGGGKYPVNTYGAANSEIAYKKLEPQVQMNLKLIFDDYEFNDAFANVSANGSLSSAAHEIVNLATGHHSVQTQVEGFTAAIRNEYSRYAKIYLGNMVYMGNINVVNATYTMFSKDGYPIRATVDLGILYEERENFSEDHPGFWEGAFDSAFTDSMTAVAAGKTGIDATSPLDTVKNLIGLSF